MQHHLSDVYVQLCFTSLLLIIVLLSCRPGYRLVNEAYLYFRLVCASGWFVLSVGLCFRLVCAFGWFVLPVGLCELKITTVHPVLTIMFKNVLRWLPPVLHFPEPLNFTKGFLVYHDRLVPVLASWCYNSL